MSRAKPRPRLTSCTRPRGIGEEQSPARRTLAGVVDFHAGNSCAPRQRFHTALRQWARYVQRLVAAWSSLAAPTRTSTAPAGNPWRHRVPLRRSSGKPAASPRNTRRTEIPAPLRKRAMVVALTTHWPEYFMEGAELGLFMISISFFAVLFKFPASPVRQAVPIPAGAADADGPLDGTYRGRSHLLAVGKAVGGSPRMPARAPTAVRIVLLGPGVRRPQRQRAETPRPGPVSFAPSTNRQASLTEASDALQANQIGRPGS